MEWSTHHVSERGRDRSRRPNAVPFGKPLDGGHAHGRTGVARVGGEGGINLGLPSVRVLMVMVHGRAPAADGAPHQPIHWGHLNKHTARVRMVLIARVSVLS
jgi:hypothetical protein